jgi:hypothetical protein
MAHGAATLPHAGAAATLAAEPHLATRSSPLVLLAALLMASTERAASSLVAGLMLELSISRKLMAGGTAALMLPEAAGCLASTSLEPLAMM